MIHLLLDPTLPAWVPWLVTYLVHSTLWIAGAGLATAGAFFHLGHRARNLVWRAVLVGPLVSVAMAMTHGPLTGNVWTVPSGADPPPVLSRKSDSAGIVGDVETFAVAPAATESAPLTIPQAPLTGIVARAPRRFDWAWLAIAGLIVVAGRAGLLFARAWRFRRRIAGRGDVFEPQALALLASVQYRMKRPLLVRLTTSDALGSPIALWNDEICLPARAVSVLDSRGLRAVLAHEIAHLERRDNLWLAVATVMETVFFLQPLLRLARRRLQATAELASDERAAEVTDDPVGLARSLADVAEWTLGSEAAVLASPAALVRSGLAHRVQSLLAAPKRAGGQSRWAPLGVVLALAVLAFLSPAAAVDAPAHVVVSQGPPRVLAARVSVSSRWLPSPQPAPPVARRHRTPRAVAVRLPPRPVLPRPVAPARSVASLAPATPALKVSVGSPHAIVLVDGNGRTMVWSGTADDEREAIAPSQKVSGDYLWIRDGDHRISVTLGSSIESVRPLLDQQRALVQKQMRMGMEQAQLAGRQAELAKQQAELWQRRAELSLDQATISARRAALNVRRWRLKVEAAAEEKRPSNNLDIQIEELGRQQAEADGQRAQLERAESNLAHQQIELGRLASQIGRLQGNLGRLRGDLSREQGVLRTQFRPLLNRLVTDALGRQKP